MKKNIHLASVGLFIFLLVVLAGCAGNQSRMKSSVVDYLYPKESDRVVETSVPVLKLPVKVGIAFVPEQSPARRGYNFWAGVVGGGALAESQKSNLLETVAENFRSYEFVREIEVIPSAYLVSGGGFSNLDQIRTMYDIDVVALVSYDQAQFTDEGLLSLTYWTLVGAYVVSGERNDTHTMVDTAVYDIESRKMLFRAPGTSNVKGRSTPVNLSEELRHDSRQGFELATTQMISNLDQQLQSFREKIKRNPEQVKIKHRAGYGGGGSFSLLSFVLLFVVGFGLRYRRK